MGFFNKSSIKKAVDTKEEVSQCQQVLQQFNDFLSLSTILKEELLKTIVKLDLGQGPFSFHDIDSILTGIFNKNTIPTFLHLKIERVMLNDSHDHKLSLEDLLQRCYRIISLKHLKPYCHLVLEHAQEALAQHPEEAKLIGLSLNKTMELISEPTPERFIEYNTLTSNLIGYGSKPMLALAIGLCLVGGVLMFGFAMPGLLVSSLLYALIGMTFAFAIAVAGTYIGSDKGEKRGLPLATSLLVKEMKKDSYQALEEVEEVGYSYS